MTSLLSPPGARTQPPAPAGGWGAPKRQRSGRLSRSRWTRWGLPVVAVLCALVAVAAFEFPRLSNLYAEHEQQVLANELDNPSVGSTTGATGAPVGRIDIPKIAIDMVVVQGDDESALAKGPGHFPNTPMPCTVGDVAIAGHRTTFLHPFYNLNEMVPGDVIKLSTRTASCTYVVSQAPFAVLPSDTAVVADTPGQYTLTLSTCTPRGSAAERLIVKATMVPGSLRLASAIR